MIWSKVLRAVAPAPRLATAVSGERRLTCLAVAAGAVGWQIITYALVMLAGNIVELGRSVFLPTIPWTTGWIAVPIVMLAALPAFALKQGLVKRLNSSNKVFISSS
jgi:hypothetical protein